MTPRRIAGIKTQINTESYPNRNCQTLDVSESSVSRIKKKTNLGEELCLQRTNKCDRKPIFTPRSERWRNFALENASLRPNRLN